MVYRIGGSQCGLVVVAGEYMSVINQMLKDLEQRRGVSQHGRYVPDSKKKSISWLVWAPLSVVLGIGAGLLVWSHIKTLTTSVKSAPVAEVMATKKPSVVVGADATSNPVSSPLQATVSVASSIAVASASVASSSASLPASVTANVPLAVAATARQEARGEKGTETALEEPLMTDDDLYANQSRNSPLAESDLTGERDVPESHSDTVDVAMPDEAPVTSTQPLDELQIEEVTLSPAEEAALQRRQAEQAIAKGDLPKARVALSALLQATPLDHQAREKLAGLLFGAGDEAGARQVLEQGMAMAPTYANYRLLLARMDMNAGRKSRALARLRDCEPEARSNLDFYATRAALAQELGDYPLAASSYQRLTVQQPTEGRWWLGLGISYEKAGRSQAALDAYHRADLTAGLSAPSREFVRQRRNRLEQRP